MKQVLLVAAILALGFSGSAFAGKNTKRNPASTGTGHGGLSECISLSVQAALDVFEQAHRLAPMPVVTVAASTGGSPTNGIDLMVTVGDNAKYYVTATPSGPPGRPTGCTNASVQTN